MKHVIRTYSKNDDLVLSRRTKIAQAAARVLVKKGYDQTNMREIAEACAMAKGTIYHYVGSKEDILYLVMEYGLARYRDLFTEVAPQLQSITPTEGIKCLIRLFYRMLLTGRTTLGSWQPNKAI